MDRRGDGLGRRPVRPWGVSVAVAVFASYVTEAGTSAFDASRSSMDDVVIDADPWLR